MYKSFTGSEFKNFLKLPADYKVSGFLSYGAWDDEKHFNKIHVLLKDLSINFTSRKLDGFLKHIYEFTIGNKIYWFAIAYGGAMLSEYVHLACLFGSQKNIHIGSCGGLALEMNSLDLVVPEWSFANESTTRIYAREVIDHKHFADKKLSDSLCEKISPQYRVWREPIMSCQAMMGETWEDVQEWSKSGFSGVEMETGTVFSVSKHFNVPAAALVYVSDNLIKGQTVGDESHIQEKERREIVKNDVYHAGIKTLIEE
ncbi:MAG: hypothetical protein WC757_03125 [Candidatus Paceibacterota bacterium]|jgi:purine-nucleoside phosphorylase